MPIPWLADVRCIELGAVDYRTKPFNPGASEGPGRQLHETARYKAQEAAHPAHRKGEAPLRRALITALPRSMDNGETAASP